MTAAYQSESMLSPVSKTALWTAAARARETDRPEAIITDPFAAILAGPEGFEWLDYFAALEQGEEPRPYLAIRTRFFDDFLLHVSRHTGIKQIVIVAAGMDTRAVRLPWPPGVSLFELDYPEVLARKEKLLERAGARLSCERHVIGTDLMQRWDHVLRKTSFDLTAPSLWLLEGLLVYLQKSAVYKLFRRVNNLTAPGSWLGADLVNTAFLKSPFMQPWLAALAGRGVPWRFAINQPESFFEEYSWRAEVTQPGEEGANFGRWPYPVGLGKISNWPRTFLIRACKRSREAQ